ncbi:GA-binding protein subunit beta-2-like [Asparagus officinalis]|uniref:GA-binding protein subunit beta-2-like n=1 Tax=Asparagus officinalis TaxID=4686 RepID=UPI00098E391C|nr:GA-binding protein subunit beta-2-like [Asparagus officinalis]
MSTRGKEAVESSRKGKEPVLPAGSEEEFDSEETETSEEAGETGSSSDERAGLPDSFFEKGLVRPSVALAQPPAVPRKRKERVIMTYPNRMTVDVLSGDEEDEENTMPLVRRQRSQSSTQAQTQVPPSTELRTKHRHEGSEAHPLKKQKKAVSKPRVHLHALEETSGHSVSSDEQGSREEGELPADTVSPGGMETE